MYVIRDRRIPVGEIGETVLVPRPEFSSGKLDSDSTCHAGDPLSRGISPFFTEGEFALASVKGRIWIRIRHQKAPPLNPGLTLGPARDRLQAG